MPDPQGLVSFPGVGDFRSCTFTLGHGISPSIATLETFPQVANPQPFGTLSFQYGTVRLDFPDCAVSRAVARFGRNGQIWNLQIVDRRWKWQFGTISGRYNVRKADETIDTDTEKTPQELATLLLDAMDETGYAVSALPNDTRPPIEWVRDNPARQLAALCDALSCRIVLGLNNRVRLVRNGVGAPLPNLNSALNINFAFTPSVRPSGLLVVGAPIIYQSKFKLKAIGRDTDGKLKPIAELDYRPDNGFQDPLSFATVADEQPDDATRKEVMKAALETVYRWYAIFSFADGSTDLFGEDASVDRMLPLFDKLVDTEIDDEGKKVPRDAFIEGEYYQPYDHSISSASTEQEIPFQLDGEKGIVKFSKPMYRIVSDVYEPAELRLTCTFHFRLEDLQTVFFENRRSLNNASTAGDLVLRRPEIQRTVIQRWDGDAKDKVEDNQEDVITEAEHYLTAAEREFADEPSGDVEYGELVAIDLDGAIQQVTWRVGPDGTFTRASRLQEYDVFTPSWAQKRRIEKQKEIEDKVLVRSNGRQRVG